MKGNDYEHPFPRMLWNCLEDSKEFYSPTEDIEAGPVAEREREELPADKGDQFLALISKKDNPRYPGIF